MRAAFQVKFKTKVVRDSKAKRELSSLKQQFGRTNSPAKDSKGAATHVCSAIPFHCRMHEDLIFGFFFIQEQRFVDFSPKDSRSAPRVKAQKQKSSSLAKLPLRVAKKRKTGTKDERSEESEEEHIVGFVTDERMRAHFKVATETPKSSRSKPQMEDDGDLQSSDSEDDPLVYHEV